jgi:hypothetical protein
MRKLKEMSVSEGGIVPDTEGRVELLNGGD